MNFHSNKLKHLLIGNLGRSIPVIGLFIHKYCTSLTLIDNFSLMEPIVERISNPEGQSFYAAKFDTSQPCKSSFWHIHAEYELVYIKNGKGKIHVGSHFSSYQDGILILLGPHIPHMPFTNFDFDDNIEVVIQFKESLLRDQLTTFPEFRDINEICQLANAGILFGNSTKQTVAKELTDLVEMSKPLQLCKLLEVLIHLNAALDRTVMNVQGMISGGKLNNARFSENSDVFPAASVAVAATH